MMIIELWKDDEYRFRAISLICLFFMFLILIEWLSGTAVSCGKWSTCKILDRNHYNFFGTLFGQVFAVLSCWVVWSIIEVYVYVSFSDVREKNKKDDKNN